MDTRISCELEALDMGARFMELGGSYQGIDANAWCFLL
jgi:hypothetical protein